MRVGMRSAPILHGDTPGQGPSPAAKEIDERETPDKRQPSIVNLLYNAEYSPSELPKPHGEYLNDEARTTSLQLNNPGELKGELTYLTIRLV